MIRTTSLGLAGLAFALTLAACGAAVAGKAPASQAPPGFWDHWGDGRAELATYTLAQPRYGELRHGEAVLITVTETFTAAQRLKSDGGHEDEYPVIKLNDVRDFQTGIYDYNAMTSTFVPLDGRLARGLPTKITMSLQEWCGHAWEQWAIDARSWHRTFHSYFDGEGDDHSGGVVPRGGVSADAMPLLVRGLAGDLVAPGGTLEVPWLPRLLDGRLSHIATAWTTATITRAAGPTSVTVPAGAFSVHRWEATPATGPVHRYDVEVAAPHRLIVWERDDGERGELLASERRTYWTESREGDEAIRSELRLPAATWPTGEVP